MGLRKPAASLKGKMRYSFCLKVFFKGTTIGALSSASVVCFLINIVNKPIEHKKDVIDRYLFMPDVLLNKEENLLLYRGCETAVFIGKLVNYKRKFFISYLVKVFMAIRFL